ncbi:sensor domain-containing diguanylate cyclase [Vibrio sp. 99-70-13A1]|uniref:GGDEF domain-containing protein n=1 Tax=Vibrio sp. 99-70-13A1 TaxID=2607601 RepID=UPI00149341C0|nr:sensor domain-containing diguanylate cyclase [Vibrio sp. 99-70-13A1]NOH96625.1 diguanylate cyclase [Vibrio sp. 99-70-13A1]
MVDMQREEWLSTLLSELPDRHLLIDKNGLIIESFGHLPLATETSDTRTVHSLLPPDLAEQLMQHALHALTSGEIKQYRYSISPCQHLQLSIEELEALGNDDEKWFESTLKPLTLANREPYILWQQKDITEAYQQEAELRRLSETDELTGILNRRAFLLGLENEMNQSQKQNVACLMIDIDHFKEINDRVGHLSGDEVITQVAHICQQSIRSNDYIGRLGGEEFGIVLPNTSAIEAYSTAEEIRTRIESTPCTVDGHTIYPTVSIGLAELNPTVTSVRELLVQADKAMYYSKQTGRNQVTIYYDNLPSIKIDSPLTAKILQAS